jgi:hypothetical protein
MDEMVCRDCGTVLAAGAHGCGTCGRNLEAERVVARGLALGAGCVAVVSLLAVGIAWLLGG